MWIEETGLLIVAFWVTFIQINRMYLEVFFLNSVMHACTHKSKIIFEPYELTALLVIYDDFSKISFFLNKGSSFSRSSLDEVSNC